MNDQLLSDGLRQSTINQLSDIHDMDITFHYNFIDDVFILQN